MADVTSAPPYSNRGVQNTYRSALRACVDWVQVTFTSVHSDTKIFEILGIESSLFETVSAGRYGYKSKKSHGHIEVLYDHGTVSGYHVQMSGQGCREFEELSSKSWRMFVLDCFANDASFTRLDAAIDDIAVEGQKPYFTVNQLYRKVKEKCVTSRFKKGKKVEGFLIEDGSSLGETLYFGRENSDLQIRFYEKDYERENAGKELEADIVAWNRTEIQCRRDRAQALAIYILNQHEDDFCRTVSGVLRNYLNFHVKSTDSNRSRWPICKWWIDFLDDVDKLKLTMQAPDRTIERTKGWVDKQVTPALAMLFYAYGSDLNLISDLLNDGLERMTPSQIKLADEFREAMEQAAAALEYDKQSAQNAYYNRTIREASLQQKKIAHLQETDDQSDK